MSRKREDKRPDRHLQLRNGNYYYKRRVPLEVTAFDTRGEHIRISLKTDDLAAARVKRDIYEAADNDYWASLILGFDGDKSKLQYSAAVKRAEAFGFSYRPAAHLAREPIESLADRFEAILSSRADKNSVAAVLGSIDQPTATVLQAKRFIWKRLFRTN